MNNKIQQGGDMRLKVKFEIDIDDGYTDDQIREWIRFELHDNGSISLKNPLHHKALKPVPFSVMIITHAGDSI